MDTMNWLYQVDKALFTLINVKGAVPALDGFFKLMRTDTTWIPLYAFILYWIIRYARPVAIPFIALWLSRPTKEKVYTTLQIQDPDSF